MLPLKFLEYTSLGLPSLCVMNRALSYYFEDEDAFFYDSNVECSLSNIIQKIALNKTILISKRNRIFNIREKFLWKTQAEKYCKLIETLIED
jgi:hypothetical protein